MLGREAKEDFMGKPIFWSLMFLISLPIAYIYALPFGLLVHGLAGNPPEVIAADIEGTWQHFLLAMLLAAAFLFLSITIHLMLRKDVYERNHEASKLVRKWHRKTLTKEEEERFRYYREIGVLTYNSNGALRVSDRAVDEFM